MNESPLMHFGEFKGYTLDEVYRIRPSYIRWAIENASTMTEQQREYGCLLLGIPYKKPRDIPDSEIKF